MQNLGRLMWQVFAGMLIGVAAWSAVAQNPPAVNPPPKALAETSTATAFMVAPRLLLTVNHALINRDRVFVGIGRGNKFIRARVVTIDERLDLALLEADVAGTPLAIAPWESVPIGIEVMALGFPRSGSAGEQRITYGIVNGEHRQGGRNDWFQLSAEIHRGNSGGPVIAVDGSVIGMISHKLDALKTAEKVNDLPQNVNFALKSKHLIEFLRQHSVDIVLRPLNLSRQIRPFEVFQKNSGSVFMVVSLRPKDRDDALVSP